ncbi:thioesterase [Sphingosinicella humi]|uniref:Thioesterase n=1 Tax=Allosphingosinicella humi TaxID=2068657 RepID=A0A2U2J499_9SPHN|nr:thioesterase [Sphingosinicella humi]PWG03144.1 thioesterase [Sphingosinicella humi]
MRSLLASTAAVAAMFALASPATAQSNRDRQSQPQQPSPLAQQAMAGSDQPDVLLDVPNLSVEEIALEVNNLQVDIALDARLANLLKLTAGANASIDNVKLTIKGVQAQATLIVRLDNVRAIIERTLQTLDNNPQLVTQLLSTVDNTVDTVGGVANNAVGTVGGVANNLLQNGQVLDLARAGLTEVSRTVNGAGETVRQVRDSSGGLLEVVTDSAGRILSSRPVTR